MTLNPNSHTTGHRQTLTLERDHRQAVWVQDRKHQHRTAILCGKQQQLHPLWGLEQGPEVRGRQSGSNGLGPQRGRRPPPSSLPPASLASFPASASPGAATGSVLSFRGNPVTIHRGDPQQDSHIRAQRHRPGHSKLSLERATW